MQDEKPAEPKGQAHKLSAAAQRALAEAAARRAAKDDSPRPREIGGRDGPDPVRYGEWEVKGIISDF